MCPVCVSELVVGGEANQSRLSAGFLVSAVKVPFSKTEVTEEALNVGNEQFR